MPPVWTMLGRCVGLLATAMLLWLAMVIDIAPFTGRAAATAMPDLLFLSVACLSLRRPGHVPGLLVLGAGLVRDLLSGAAVGPGALALLLAARFLRARAPALRRRSLAVEWLDVAAMALVVVMLPALMLWLTLADTPPVAALSARLGMTVLAYPLVVAVLRVGRDRTLRQDDTRADPA